MGNYKLKKKKKTHNTKTHFKKKKKPSILIRVIRKNRSLLCAIVLFIDIYCYIFYFCFFFFFSSYVILHLNSVTPSTSLNYLYFFLLFYF